MTTIADLLKAKRHMKARATEGSDDPDEEVFAELCAVLLKHGVTGERAEGILRRMIAGVQPVVAGEVQ